MPQRSVASVLVYVGCDLVGDGLMKLPFVRALRTSFPTAHITWLAGCGTTVYAGSLALLVAGLLDNVVTEEIGEFVAQHRATGQYFDLIIDTQRSLPTTLKLRRVPHRRFISGTLGFLLSSDSPRHRFRKLRSLSSQLLELAVLAGGRPIDPAALVRRPHLPPDIEADAARLLPAGPTYVGLAPGAGGRAKCWPLENYLELGGRLAAAGHVPVMVLGPAETSWIARVRSDLPHARLPLQEARQPSPLLTVALGRYMSAAVANDSGAGHMLAAADVPMVSLFGPTSPGKFAPLTRRLTVLRAQDFGGSTMAAIPVEAVWDRVVTLLHSKPG